MAESLALYFDQEAFTPGEIAEVLGFMSDLYWEISGDTLVIERIQIMKGEDLAEERSSICNR